MNLHFESAYHSIPLFFNVIRGDDSELDRRLFFTRLREMHPQVAAILIEECLWNYHQGDELVEHQFD